MEPDGGLLKHTVMALFLLLKVARPWIWGVLKRLLMDGRLDSLMHTHQLLGALRMPLEMWHLMDPLHRPFAHWINLRGHLHDALRRARR